jgi:UDP-N-acetylmuramate dehydrogenase
MEKINRKGKFSAPARFDEPMSGHTTFKVGGKADVWVRPGKDIFPDYSARLLESAQEEGIPVFILGAGANIVVSDNGIRGIVLDTGSYRSIGKREERTPQVKDALGKENIEEIKAHLKKSFFSVPVLAGTSVDSLSSRLAGRGLSGLEFLAGMPGSVGGAVWMNARCYEKSVSDILLETEILDEKFRKLLIPACITDFSYKKSPFQSRKVLILSARFAVQFRDSSDIKSEIRSYRRDREDKGHYRFPSAGSAFKNNRDFGESTGMIIDKLGLRGFSAGGARIAPWHGNIIINTGGATAADIKTLMNEVTWRVKAERGFDLESEIIFVGDWGE